MPITAPESSAIAVRIVADAYSEYDTYSTVAFDNAIATTTGLQDFFATLQEDIFGPDYGGLSTNTEWAAIQTQLASLKSDATALAGLTVTAPDLGTLTAENILIDGDTASDLTYTVTPTTAETTPVPSLSTDEPGADAITPAAPVSLIPGGVISAPTVTTVDIEALNLDVDFSLPSYLAPTTPVLDLTVPDSTGLILEYEEITDNSSLYSLADLDTFTEKLMSIVLGTDDDADQALTHKLLWERAQDRETYLLEAAVDEALQEWERKGFALPTAVVTGASRSVKMAMRRKLIDINRDIAVQQIEVLTSKFNVAAGQIALLQSKLIESNDKHWQRKLQAAEAMTNANIAAFAARVDLHNADVATYNAGVQAYSASWEGVRNAVAVYQAQLAGVGTEIDATRVGLDVYKASLEGAGYQLQAQANEIKLYEAKILNSQLAIEQTKATIEAQSSAAQSTLYQAQANLATTEAKYRGTTALANAKAAVHGVAADVTRANASAIQANNAGQGLILQAAEAKVKGIIDSYRAETEAGKLAVSRTDQQIKAQELEIDAATKPLQASIELLKGYAQAIQGYGQTAASQASIDLDKATTLTNAALQAKSLEVQAHNNLAAAALNAINISASASSSGIVTSTT